MKILTIAATPYFSDRGCHIRIFLEAKYLQKKGIKNTICTYHLGKDVGDFGLKRISNVACYKKTSPGFAWGKIWLDLKLLKLCIREIKQNKPEIIHAHLYEGLLIGWLAKNLAGERKILLVVDLQGDLKSELASYNKKNTSVVKNILVLISNWIINSADAVVISSERMLKSISEKFKKQENIFVIKDGIDLESFENNVKNNLSLKAKKELAELKKWKGNKKVLIYTGGMEKGKGVEELLEGFLKIKNEIKDWKLLLYGQGSKRAIYQELIIKNNAQNSVRLVEENGFFVLPNFLKMANIAIDPKKSSTESSGKLMNYMAANLPIICFNSRFNQERLRKRGSYLEKISDLKSILKNFKIEKMEYNLDKKNETIQAEKLSKIFENLIGKQKQ